MMILKDKRIFIVEDDMRNRVVFQVALMRAGAQVDFERWEGNSIQRLRNSYNPVDLIILDLMLPNNHSGFDVFDQIRAVERFVDIPVVAVSAMDPSVAVPKAIQKGLNGFIAKPIDNVLFPKQLVKILANEPVWDSGIRSIEMSHAVDVKGDNS
jgi:CheY-like chemotaxis protein